MGSKKFYILSLPFILIGLTISAQQNLADSVRLLLEKELPDTTRAFNMVMLAMYTEPVDMGKAHTIYKEAVDFSLAKDLNYYAALALYYEVTPYHHSGNRAMERENLFRAIELLRNSQHYKAKAQLGSVYGGLANYYQAVEKTDSAVIASLNSIKILEELKKYRSLAISCMNLAMTYQQLKLPDKQKEYVDKGLVYAKISKDNSAKMLAYLQQGSYYTEIRDFQKAKIYVDSASVYFSDKYDFSRKQNFYLLKAGTFQNVNQYDSAIFYFQKSYENAKQINSRWNMTEPLMQIGYIYLQQKDYIQAEKYVKMGLEIAEADSIRVFIKEGYGTLSDIYAASGNYKEAFELLGKYNDIKDDLQSEERKKFALDLDKKYESEKKDVQLKLQHAEIAKRRSINHAISVLTVLLLVIFLLAYRTFKQKQKLQEQRIHQLEAEKLLSATEAVLKGEEQERTRLAKDLHDGLGGLLSGIKYSFQNMKENLILTPGNAQVFERSLDMLDTSIHEMRRVAHNLMPENLLKFGLDAALKDFCSNINASGVLKLNYQSFGFENGILNESVSVSVYRIIQELVNNIVKHANAHLALVQLTKSGDLLLIDVEDDGKGFDLSELSEKKGIGWSNIYSRLEYLNGKLDIESQPGKGASIHIEIKI